MSRNRLTGALILSFSNAARIVLQFALVPYMARLLGPQAYGLAALALPFIFFVNLFADAGLGNAVARMEVVDRRLLSTAFWLSGLLGFALSLLMAAGACLVMWKHPDQQIALVMLGFIPMLFMSALCATPNGMVTRTGQFKIFAIADIVSTLVSGVVAVILAMNNFGVWALVWQQNILWLLRLSIILFYSGLRPKFEFDLKIISPHMIFAISTVGIAVVDFLARSVDNVLIGWTIGPAALGAYAMAYQLIRAPELLIAGPIYASLFSAFAANAADPAALGKTYKTAMRAVVEVSAPLLAGLALVADLVIPLILGPKWTASIAIVQCLSLAGLLLCVWTVIGALLVGAGRPQIQLRNSMSMAIATIIGILVGAAMRSAVAVAAAVSIAMCIPLVPMLRRAAEVSQTRMWDLLWCLRGPLLGVGAMAIADAAVRPLLDGFGGLTELVILVTVDALAYVLVVWAANREAADEDLQNIRAVLLQRGSGHAATSVRQPTIA